MAEIFGLDALLAGEAGHRLRRGGFRRPQDALFAIGLTRGQAFGAQHQASRGGIQGDGIVGDLQLFEKQPQVFERRRDHPIGNLFGADFEQEGEAHWATSCAMVLCC